MTSRERLLTVLRGGIPDCVPVAPDFSNMIPARLTGRPWWDIYLYNDPPQWQAYIDCAKHFDIDALMDGYFPFDWHPESEKAEPEWERCIVAEDDTRLVVQGSRVDGGQRVWRPWVTVYYRDQTPAGIVPEKIGLPAEPKSWRPVEGVKSFDRGPAGFKEAKERLGEQGLIGLFLVTSCVIGNEAEVYDYFDNPGKYEALAEQRIEEVERRFEILKTLEVKPDFICVGGSGTLVLQTVEMFRTIAFPAVKRAIELAESIGLPTHVHSCGPEAALVKIMAEETNLTVIDPLEIPPMGDCNLAEIKRQFGHKLTLKGNLHTSDVMLRGSVQEVIAASRKAIDDAACGGRFILSTGDQCGRDTPYENLRAMVATAREYGRYRADGSVCGLATC